MTTLAVIPSWHLSAACRDVDGDLFFDEDRAAEAKAICAGCPTRVRCLDAALARGEQFGIYGGKDSAERRRIADASDEVHRPSAAGRWQHGSRSGFAAHGCRCARCREAQRAYVAHWRQTRRWAATSRGVLVPIRTLDRPAGRGLHRAWPGQLAIAWEAA